MLGLNHWTRSFTYDAHGNIVRDTNGNPVFAAHPQPNCWKLIAENAKAIAATFDFVQLPPWCNGSGESYTPFNLRDLNSNWGKETELVTAGKAGLAEGLELSADYAFRAQNGENGGPGVFKYPGGIGNTLASWFQDRGQPGESIPPFVQADDVFDPSGDYPFGRCRAYQHGEPHGAVADDSISALDVQMKVWTPGKARIDNGKATYMPFLQQLVGSLRARGIDPYAEVDTGNPQELDAWVRYMGYLCGVEDYAQFWNTQRACNGYDFTQFNPPSQPGYWRWNNGMTWGFANNPDVATSWGPGGSISQQIAFNLLMAYAVSMPLPFHAFLVYGEDYYPASPDWPTGRGFKPFIDNIAWVCKQFAYGAFQERWRDKDVYAYTRNGDGGGIGQSGGLLVVANINTYDTRTVTLDTMWNQGDRIHNYSATGHDEYAYVGAGGRVTITVLVNAYSSGQSYQLWAQG
jgi:alpha-amylase